MKNTERKDWAERIAELEQRSGSGAISPARVNRLGNPARATHIDGIRFASKLEADRYRELKLLQKAGDVRYTLRQVPFDVATGVVYRLDFLVVWNRAGSASDVLSYEDCKGVLTEVSRLKIAAVQDRYGITIRLLTRKDVRR